MALDVLGGPVFSNHFSSNCSLVARGASTFSTRSVGCALRRKTYSVWSCSSSGARACPTASSFIQRRAAFFSGCQTAPFITDYSPATVYRIGGLGSRIVKDRESGSRASGHNVAASASKCNREDGLLSRPQGLSIPSSLIGGRIGEDLAGDCRIFSYFAARRCGNCPPASHHVVCDAERRRQQIGSFTGSQDVGEPWSWMSDSFVLRARNERRPEVSSSEGELSRGLLRESKVPGATNIGRLRRADAAQPQPLTSARPRCGTNRNESPPRRILRNCIPQSHDTPPKRDTGIASEKDWGINLKNELTSESGINEDGGTWYRESGEDVGDNGYRCRWTVMGGKNAEGSSEWKEAWWEKSDWTGYKELGAEKSGKNAQGDTWWETWQEILRQDDWSNLARIEKSAQKQAKAGSGSAGWYEKWWEKYNAKGWSEKGAHKYGRLNDQGWWEKWGEQYDGRGAVSKWTDKWAETDMGTKWGDKWEEKFNQGIGTRQGETWHFSANGERWSRTWGEEHVGTGKVHKYGKSTSGESWDSVVEEGTFYQAEPHYGWADAVGNSVQLLAIEALERPPGIYPDLDLGMPPLPSQ